MYLFTIIMNNLPFSITNFDKFMLFLENDKYFLKKWYFCCNENIAYYISDCMHMISGDKSKIRIQNIMVYLWLLKMI